MQIQRASPEDFPQIVDLFRKYDFALVDRKWFDWKHLGNPAGSSMVFMLLSDDSLDGTFAIIPQSFRWGSKSYLGMQAVDGLMGSSLRGKRLFTRVMRYVIECQFPENCLPVFRIGYASLPASMRALENSGWKRVARFKVMKAVVRSSAFKRLPGGGIVSLLLKPIVGLHRVLLFRGHAGTEVVPIAQFREDLNHFQPEDRVCGDRSSRFLNWRVTNNPRDGLRAYCFKQGQNTVGYLVCKYVDRTCEVLEFRSNQQGPHMIAAFLRHIYENNLADVVDVWLVEGFEQYNKLPRPLISRGFNGAMFISGHDEVGVPDDNRCWAASYLDSDW